jgi:phospholipid/cholesterol/gamma-HCH transport system permease protein
VIVNRVWDFLQECVAFVKLSLAACRAVPHNLRHPLEFLKAVYEIGVKTVPIILLTGLFTGMILGLELADTLEAMIAGTSQFIGAALSVSLLKELGPVLTSLIVVSRVCSSVTAKIGTMRVTEQIDALQTFAVDPVDYLVTPRFLAGIVCVPVLAALSIAIGFTGGWITIILGFDVDNSVFWEMAQFPLRVVFVWEYVAKTAVIGGFVLLVSTYMGFTTKGGADGVGKATIRSVVTSSMAVIVLDYLIGLIFIFLN